MRREGGVEVVTGAGEAVTTRGIISDPRICYCWLAELNLDHDIF